MGDMEVIYGRPESLKDVRSHYCAGCGHGTVHRLIAELVDEFGIREKTVAVAPVGCAVLAYDYFNFDVCEAPHGRTPAVATGLKRARPDNFIISYQGDGDLAAIGMAEIIHAANRGERMTVVFVNNGLYGMTGGQMAPTTLLGQVTETSPYGRDRDGCGCPIRVCELLSQFDGVVYAARCAIDKPGNIVKGKKMLKKAFSAQLENRGFSIVEFLSACPTHWKKSAADAARVIEEKMVPYFPLGVIKNTAGGDA
jgi:2-oxoglutarate/2-oxoacid ferredoxin oxidoreductase subunit beta